MYAITEAIAVVGGTVSRDQYTGDWWSGDGWTPAEDQAAIYDTREEAEAIARALGRTCHVVTIEES